MTGKKRGVLAYRAAAAEWERDRGGRTMTEPAARVPQAVTLHEVQQTGALTPVARAPMTPMDMLEMAVRNNAGIEVLERLTALYERWDAGRARRAFDEAIAAAKARIKPVVKNRKVDFTSEKGRTNYDFEDLAEIARQVDPILADYGLSYRFRSGQDGPSDARQLTVTCIISHRDGYSEENSLSAGNDKSGNKNAIQAIGSTATYLQRYTLKLALGLAAAKDDDAQAASALPAPATLSGAQLEELITLAEEVGADKAKFCKCFNLKSFADIPADKFGWAKQKLELKRPKAKAEAADAAH